MGVVANAPSCKVYMQLLPIAFKEVSLRLNFIESLAAIFVVLYHYVPEKKCLKYVYRCRSSGPDLFNQKAVFEIFAKFAGKHLFLNIFS